MNIADKQQSRIGKKEGLIQCPVCDDYFQASEGFFCPKCRKGPLCKRHRVPGRKECTSCIVDIKLTELKTLRAQERNLRHFIRFTEFIIFAIAIYYLALKYDLLDEVYLDFLERNFFADHLIPIGVAVVIVSLIFYAVLLNQRQKIAEIESDIERTGAR